MGCNTREKSTRSNRKNRSTSAKQSKSMIHDGIKAGNPNPSPSSNPKFDGNGWGYCTEEQLEELLLKNLEFLYNEAISKLISLGYEENIALEALLRNGHCYGTMDALTNILNNSLAYLDSGSNGEEKCEENKLFFSDLRQLQERSIAGMVGLLQQFRPQLSKGDAMWCLLMSDLNIARACTMEIPILTDDKITNNNEDYKLNLCKFHEDWGLGGSELPPNVSLKNVLPDNSTVSLASEIECPDRFNLSPAMKCLLRRNVAAFAAGWRESSNSVSHTHSQSNPFQTSLLNSAFPSAISSAHLKDNKGPFQLDSELMHAVLNSLGNMSIDDKLDETTDQRNEIILNLTQQIKELEVQVKERKEWAHLRAMQAAKRLSHDLQELNMLRMEREETQRYKKGKQTLEDTTMKKLSEMEDALRRASSQVDRANAAVKRLEIENAVIRAEMEASKLSAAETDKIITDLTKKEKKYNKKFLACEKQKGKLQEETAEERRKIADMQDQLNRTKEMRQEFEEKWIHENKAKEVAISQVEKERRLKSEIEISIKRRQETLRRKIVIDFQKHKDDIQRLEQELSRLKESEKSMFQTHQKSNILHTGVSDSAKIGTQTYERLLSELHKPLEASFQEVDHGRKCIKCMKEVSVVFLPCAHQVVCTACNKDHEKKGKTTCPCCKVHIEQRIRVYGPN